MPTLNQILDIHKYNKDMVLRTKPSSKTGTGDLVVDGMIQEIIEAIDECLRNVDDYIADSKTLIETGSYGHSLSLAIMGREELGKAAWYIPAAFGFYDLKPLLNRHTCIEGKRQLSPLYDHRLKEMMIRIFKKLQYLIDEDLGTPRAPECRKAHSGCLARIQRRTRQS